MATSTSGTISSPGIGSGLDVATIVAKLMAIEQRPLTALDTKEAGIQAKISAYGSLKGALSSFQSALQSLTNADGFHTVAASAADPTLLSASAGAKATPGSYSVEITQLAQAQKLASAGVAATTTVIGSGTLTFDFGTVAGSAFTPNGGGSKSVTIGASQNSLAGVRDAVNAANIGVTATIVNDGSAAGNRLVFTATASGAANSIKLTVADVDGGNTDTAGLSQLAYDPAAVAGSGQNLTQKVAAQDAQLLIDGIAITRPTNAVADAIEGVSLTLSKTNIGSPTTLSVTQNTGAASNAVQGFVKAYNDLNTTLGNLTKYDPSTKRGSVLTGDSGVRIIQSQLRSLIGGTIPGAGGAAQSLSQVGVRFQQDGTVTFDTAAFNTAVGTDPAGIARVFAAVSAASDSLISTGQTGSKTQPGTYGVNVTQLATRGAGVGSTPAGLSITAGVNDQLLISLDGIATTVTLTAGTYASAAALAADIQGKLNGAAQVVENSSSASVSESGGVITVTSNRYGAASTVALAGSATATVFGGPSVATAGIDAAGTIGGVIASASGQELSGPTGSVVEGLKLTVAGGATGARGNVSYTQGFAYRLDQMVKHLLDAGGIVAASTDGANRTIKDIDHKREALSARLDIVEAQYRAQFSKLDTLLGSMSVTSNYLTQQLANLPKIQQSGN